MKLIIVASVHIKDLPPPTSSRDYRLDCCLRAKAQLRAQSSGGSGLVGHTIDPDLTIRRVGSIDYADGMGHGWRPLEISPAYGQSRHTAGLIRVYTLITSTIQRSRHIVIDLGITKTGVVVGGTSQKGVVQLSPNRPH